MGRLDGVCTTVLSLSAKDEILTLNRSLKQSPSYFRTQSHSTLVTPDWHPRQINFHQDFVPLKMKAIHRNIFLHIFLRIVLKGHQPFGQLWPTRVARNSIRCAKVLILIPHATPGTLRCLRSQVAQVRIEFSWDSKTHLQFAHYSFLTLETGNLLHLNRSVGWRCVIGKTTAAAAEFIMMAKNGF